MLDFTSALYLGFTHASSELRSWPQLTTGVPAALAEPPLARSTTERLAALMGTEDGVLARSTLHVFWDIVLILARESAVVFLDQASYPVARWGVERAVSHGISAFTFPHHEVDTLRHLIRKVLRNGQRPLIVSDGVCPGCERRAPVQEYMDIAIAAGGRLLIDDTQALGLVGPCGGGSLRACDLPLGGVVVASLAKAFAAPLAFVGGARHDVASYIDESETRVHLSPPSLVDIHAADSAVRLNRRLGATRRRRLQAAINYLRYGLSANGLQPRPPMQQSTLFPVQAIPPIRGLSARYVHQRLLNAGIRGVLHTSCDGQPRVSLVLRATHTRAQLDRALAAVAGAC